MKKHLLIIGLLALMMPLSAETLNICKTFEKLLTHVNDFKPLMAGRDTNSILANFSTIQLEGAKSSQFTNGFEGVSFEADLGSFKTKNEAMDKQKEWSNALKACYPGMDFTFIFKNMPDFKAEYIYYYPFIKNETSIRLYEANFCISNIISDYDLNFIFPQVEKASIFNSEVPAYTDFTLITQDKVDSPFGKALSEILRAAILDFEEIMGDLSLEDVSDDALAYEVSLKLPGYSSCLIERNTSDQLGYVVNLCADVDKATFEAKMTSFMKQLMSALGKDYAYKTTSSGKGVYFVSADGPTDTVAIFSYTEKNGKYSARFKVNALSI